MPGSACPKESGRAPIRSESVRPSSARSSRAEPALPFENKRTAGERGASRESRRRASTVAERGTWSTGAPSGSSPATRAPSAQCREACWCRDGYGAAANERQGGSPGFHSDLRRFAGLKSSSRSECPAAFETRRSRCPSRSSTTSVVPRTSTLAPAKRESAASSAGRASTARPTPERPKSAVTLRGASPARASRSSAPSARASMSRRTTTVARCAPRPRHSMSCPIGCESASMRSDESPRFSDERAERPCASFDPKAACAGLAGTFVAVGYSRRS